MYCNTSIKMSKYMYLNGSDYSALYLSGIKNNDTKFNTTITKINDQNITRENITQLVNDSNKQCSHIFINNQLYKITISYEQDFDITDNANSKEWDNSISYRFNIPSIIWCYMIGMVSATLQ
jgi:hypothetical protein